MQDTTSLSSDGGPMRLRVKRRSERATLPYRASAKAAGYDICSAEAKVLAPGAHAMFNTDLSLEVPEGHYGRVAPRSGLAAKHAIDVMAGVIDADYRGELKVILINHSDDTFTVAQGDRIAQLILERISTPDVEEIAEHTETARGEGGFGSTGIKAASPSEAVAVAVPVPLE